MTEEGTLDLYETLFGQVVSAPDPTVAKPPYGEPKKATTSPVRVDIPKALGLDPKDGDSAEVLAAKAEQIKNVEAYRKAERALDAAWGMLLNGLRETLITKSQPPAYLDKAWRGFKPTLFQWQLASMGVTHGHAKINRLARKSEKPGEPAK